MNDEKKSRETPETRLAYFYHRNGYVRSPDSERRRSEDRNSSYKKGWEVRLVARDEEELAELHRLLDQSSFEPGNPFDKGRQTVLPLYGKASTQRFLEIVNDEEALGEEAEGNA